MFARKIRVEYVADGESHPCPLKWLDNFSMRNFTNASIFDDTIPVADGVMEVGARVPLSDFKGCHGRLVPAQKLSAKRGLAPHFGNIKKPGDTRRAPAEQHFYFCVPRGPAAFTSGGASNFSKFLRNRSES